MDDWQAGDLALCVDDRPCPVLGTNGGLQKGRIYHVAEVLWMPGGFSELHGRASYALTFACATNSFAPQRFRKIRPLTDEERDSFLAEVKTREPTHAR